VIAPDSFAGSSGEHEANSDEQQCEALARVQWDSDADNNGMTWDELTSKAAARLVDYAENREYWLNAAGAAIAAGWVSPEVHAAAIREAAAAQAVIDAALAPHREGVAYADDIAEGTDVPEDYERHYCDWDGEDWPCSMVRVLSAAPHDALDSKLREARAAAVQEYHERREAGQSHYSILRDMGALSEQEAASPETPAQCLSCDEPRADSGEGRYCGQCQDYEGTCINDHCLTCGAST